MLPAASGKQPRPLPLPAAGPEDTGDEGGEHAPILTAEPVE